MTTTAVYATPNASKDSLEKYFMDDSLCDG